MEDCFLVLYFKLFSSESGLNDYSTIPVSIIPFYRLLKFVLNYPSFCFFLELLTFFYSSIKTSSSKGSIQNPFISLFSRSFFNLSEMSLLPFISYINKSTSSFMTAFSHFSEFLFFGKTKIRTFDSFFRKAFYTLYFHWKSCMITLYYSVLLTRFRMFQNQRYTLLALQEVKFF